MSEYTDTEQAEIAQLKRQLAENASWRRDSQTEESNIQTPEIKQAVDSDRKLVDADRLALEEKITNLKRALSMANAEIEANKKSKEDSGEIWMPPAQTLSPENQAKVAGLKDDVEIGREALELERAGYSYAEALKIAEAVHKGDFEVASKYMEMHENNERTVNADAIRDAEEQAQLRRWFGLSTF